MKLITYSKDNSTSCGILTGDFIIDIPSAWPAPNPPRSLGLVKIFNVNE